MKKILLLLLVSAGTIAAFAQEAPTVITPVNKRPAAIGISFFLNDYVTAQRIRTTSLNSVLANKSQARFRDMSPGLAVTYFQGLTPHIDFAGTAAGSFVTVNLPNKPANNDRFLLEADASAQFKMFPESFVFTPYLNAGVGVSLYNGELGAFLPLGGGVKVNLFNEASVFINAQYRTPVIAETSAHHFFYGLGIAGVIGKK